MHLRRAILLSAVVLGATAVAAALSSPTRKAADSADDPPRGAPAVLAPGGPAAIGPRAIAFRAREGSQAVDRKVQIGDHVVVSVNSPEGGVVTIPRLGRTASVAPAAPARFDLLLSARGRYDVLFAADSLDEPRRVGTLVVSSG